MKELSRNEIIVVRSLTDSDLGLFAAHRPRVPSKQRAININSAIAQLIVSPKIFDEGGIDLPCRILLQDIVQDSKRHFGKIHKNWRLGGRKIEGDLFSKLDSRDFALIRTIEGNDGSNQLTVLFVSRAIQSFNHARIVRLVEPTIKDSMGVYREGSAGFQQLAMMFPAASQKNTEAKLESKPAKKSSIPLMPRDEDKPAQNRTIKDKMRTSHILEEMLKASIDLSAPAQLSFMENVELLASQLRDSLLTSGMIIKLNKNHPAMWREVAGKQIGFVDGGLANLSMLGSTPIAARVGGYIVTPGDKTENRERFVVLRKLINELFASNDDSIYTGAFPDISALRDAARISIEAAGAVKLIKSSPAISFLFLHGALVNPVSRYTDVMQDGRTRFAFPNFSTSALDDLLPNSKIEAGTRASNFINVYLKQLLCLQNSSTTICGVIEREATTSSVTRSLLASLDENVIAKCLPIPPQEWKKWFLSIVDPLNEEDGFGQRITDSLLFRCVLEPGEAINPVLIDRNEIRRAPDSWKQTISDYPKPYVSYLQPSEWSSPIRLEIFEKDKNRFKEIANLIYHCSLLLPRYAFPAGLDIVDKFAKIPNWMSRPINTNTAVQALKGALYKGDENLFNTIRRMLCGSSREWLLRPGVFK